MEVQDWKMCSTSSVARSSNSIVEARHWASKRNDIMSSFSSYHLVITLPCSV